MGSGSERPAARREGHAGDDRLRAYLAFAVAGFRRHSTYLQATVAACVTNSVFGFLRAAVMLAVLAAGGSVIAGYDAPKLMTFVGCPVCGGR